MTAGTDARWTRRLFALTVTAAIAVSVIYLPQSLLTAMAEDLGVAPGVASAAATTVQVGYALGIILLVPLADRLHPRRQVTVQSLLLAASLLLSAVLPTVLSVALGFFIVGFVANIAQIIIPVSARLAPAGRVGATTSTLVGGLLTGIFGGRILASVLVAPLGWRWVTVVFALLVLAAVPFARRALDADLPLAESRPTYPRLLLRTVTLVRKSPALFTSAMVQFFVFASFISLWTVMVLHFTEPPFDWSVLGAGLFGFVGLAAGLLTPFGGRLIDRFGPLPVTGAFLALLLVALSGAALVTETVVPFGIAVFLATWANQGIQSANQSRALAANPHSAAQANTMFMFFVFLGGSAGALLGPIAYQAGGMELVAWQAAGFTVLAGVTWALTVGYERRAASARGAVDTSGSGLSAV